MSSILVQNIKHTNGTTAATIDTAGVFSSAGHVIQAVTNRDNTATNVTSADTFVDTLQHYQQNLMGQQQWSVIFVLYILSTVVVQFNTTLQN